MPAVILYFMQLLHKFAGGGDSANTGGGGSVRGGLSGIDSALTLLCGSATTVLLPLLILLIGRLGNICAAGGVARARESGYEGDCGSQMVLAWTRNLNYGPSVHFREMPQIPPPQCIILPRIGFELLLVLDYGRSRRCLRCAKNVRIRYVTNEGERCQQRQVLFYSPWTMLIHHLYSQPVCPNYPTLFRDVS